jgi:lipopolysaccharide/colanic/teichoic acid biosynthesis glycosyltransferase
MIKHPFRFSRSITRNAPWFVLRGTLGVLCVLVLLLVAWWFGNELIRAATSRSWGSPLLFVFYLICAVLVERSLSLTPVRRDWRYRLSFLIPSLQFLLLWLIALVRLDHQANVVWLLAASGGVFLGCLLATGIREGIWENNSPPSPRIQEEVHQRHMRIAGIPGKTSSAKRLFDLLLSIGGLIVSIPVWLVMIILLWLEDPGPLLFVKNSVGKGGVNFHQYKFRTMVRGAESGTGPVLASRRDERVLIVGSLLRKTALDELPQVINILKGEMSFVGPRPQRTVLVHGYLEKMPEYAERHSVLPGLSGLAQVAGDYYLTPRQKLRFDRLYIQHASLGYDIKLLILAFLITFWYRWQNDWNGRLPRQLLRWGSS